MSRKVKNYSLDCMRGIACLFVVLIHCPLPGTAGEILKGIGRFAVPFFVMISGFFWYRKDDKQRHESTKHALGNIVKLTIVGVLFCSLVNSVGSLMSGQGAFHWFTSAFTGTMVWEFLIFNRAAFLSSVMYYLFGMIYTYVLVLWMNKYRLMKYGLFVVPVLLVANVCFSTILDSPWYCAGNWLFTCVPFFFCGYYLRIRGKRIIHLPLVVWMAVACAGVLFSVIEWNVFGDVYCGIGTVLLSVAVFVMCLKKPDMGQKHPKLVIWIREMSTGIFLVHCTFRDVLNNVLGSDVMKGYKMPVIVLTASLLFVWGIRVLNSLIQAENSK